MQVRQTDKSEGPIYLSPTQSSTQVLHATQPNNQHAHEPGVIAPPALACSAACRGLRILHALDARRPHSPATTAACRQPRPLPHGCEGRAVHSAVRTSLSDALLAARSGWRDRAPRPPPRAQRAGWGALADGGEHRARAQGPGRSALRAPLPCIHAHHAARAHARLDEYTPKRKRREAGLR